jgi:hypothetical protein
MIRRPSTFTETYAWHRAAVGDPDAPRDNDLPEAGWFKMKRVSGGPWVPAEIRLVQVTDPDTGELAEPERFVATVDGLPADPVAIWSRVVPITRAEYLSLVERQRTDDRFAASMVPYDIAAQPTLPPRRGL